MKRILKSLAVMAVLLSLAAVPALAETKNGPLVFSNYYDSGTGSLNKYYPETGLLRGFSNTANTVIGEDPDVTPDGETVVYESFGRIYSAPMYASGSPTRLTTDDPSNPSSIELWPVISPDGKTVYFQYNAYDDHGGVTISDIYSVPIEGGDITRVTHDNRDHLGLEITPDGENFLYRRFTFGEDDTFGKLYVQPVSGGPATILYDCDFDLGCGDPAVSPDGTKVAFTLPGAVYTMPFSTTAGGTPTKVSGSEFPYHEVDRTVAFSPDGKYIAYNSFLLDDNTPSSPCGAEFICDEAQTRWIPVEGGNYNSRVWGNFFAPVGVVWAPAPSDTTAPQFGPLPDITEEATKPSGAAVTFSATATDAVDPNPRVSCQRRIPPQTQFFSVSSGATFPIGTITVTCTAEDRYHNRATDSFNVTVRDTTPPTITGMPSDIFIEATGADGAQVSWSQPTATDLVNGSRTVNCTPASGTTFALGETTVSCTATDTRSNTATETFKVTVQDTTAPTVDAVNLNPVDGAKEVARGSSVTANFSEAVQAATLTSETVQLFSGNSTRPIKATLGRNPSTNPTSVTLTPSSKLDAKTRYTAKIKGGQSGVKDLAGNPLDQDPSTLADEDMVWSFTTGSR